MFPMILVVGQVRPSLPNSARNNGTNMFSIVVRMGRRHLSTPTLPKKNINHNVFDGFGGLHAFFMLWMVEWGAWAGPESLQVEWNPCIFHDLFGGVGTMGGFRIIENTKGIAHFS